MKQTVVKVHEFSILNQTLVLHPFKSIYWKEKGALLIADMHLGKSMHFRKAGIAIPQKVSDQNWSRFIRLLEEFRPETVIFLGDLFHSAHNCEWNSFIQILENYPHIRLQLVVGNHDILEKAIYRKAGMEIFDNHLLIDKFIFSHYPLQEVPGGYYNLSGHVHPGVRLKGNAKQGLKLPCFFFGENCGILPAFGAFTGCALIKPQKNDSVMVVVNDHILQVQ